MSAFDSRMVASSKSIDRSRSTPEKGNIEAARHRIIAQGTPISEPSSSEGRGQNVQRDLTNGTDQSDRAESR